MSQPNPYFNITSATNEQGLLDSLIVESINIHGSPVFYCPRRTYDKDLILTEDAQNYFDTAYPTVAYIKNVEGFEGQGHFLSAMGLEIRDQVTFTIANTTFLQDIGYTETFTRPNEGDLIYFPQNKKVFEIVFVEKFAMYYPLGTLYSYDLTCQLLEYTSQNFSTGIEDIDSIEPNLTEDFLDWAWLNEDGTFFITEGPTVADPDYVILESYDTTRVDSLDQTDEIKRETDLLMDFTETSPFSEEF